MDGYITSFFGERENPLLSKQENHNGIDIACETGTPAVAAADGVVTETGVSQTYGKYLKYRVGGYTIFYAHLSEVLASEGEKVVKGQVVAKTGNTGLSTGPHLHLSVFGADGAAKDPLLFFDGFSAPEE